MPRQDSNSNSWPIGERQHPRSGHYSSSALTLSVSTVQRSWSQGTPLNSAKEHEKKIASTKVNHTMSDWFLVTRTSSHNFNFLDGNDGRAFVRRRPGEACRELRLYVKAQRK